MPQHLISMALTKKDRKTVLGSHLPDDEDAPRFPFGLSISLDEISLEKLGIDEDLPHLEQKLFLEADVVVESARSEELKGGKKSRHLGLQITALRLIMPGKKSTADVLFGDDQESS